MTASEDAPAGSHLILIVDAQPAELAPLVHLLEQRGDRVVVLENGEQALQYVQHVLPDLVLLNVMMPGMDGPTTCRHLKEQEDLREVPVIFMTASDDNAQTLACFAAGGVDYVTKPFRIDEVLARMHTHLALRWTQCRLAEQNEMLQREVALREEIESYLQYAYELLEERVAHRTEELAQANAQLTAEIDERRRVEHSLRRSELRMRRLIDANIIGIYFWEADGRIVEANDAFLRMIGYTQQDVLAGQVRWDQLTPAEYQMETERGIKELVETGCFTPYEKEYMRKDGSRVPILIGGAVISQRQKTGAAFVLDLSERKQAEDRIRYMADHDALTGLPNRALLRDRLQQALAHAARTHTNAAVLFIDLDYFKHINDSLGHQVGDASLRFVADRLLHCVREGDSVARLGGDEFVLALPLVGGASDVAMVAQKVLDALDAPFHCSTHELHVAGSIGISMYPDDGRDVDTLMRAADTAMYYAKEKGRRNFQFFTQSLNKAAQRRHQLTMALRHALTRGELMLYYQPQVTLESGAIFSAEALLRWKQDDEPPVPCHEFITIAEETGLILPIGEWVLRQACEQLKRWRESGYTDLTIAVNLSPRQFFQPNFQNMIVDVLNETGIPADRLDLEITEGTLMHRTEDNVETLTQLSHMGIKLSIDDFGTGYSSLAYLQRFPVNALKIDRSFVSGIGQDSSDTALVAAIISMANSLHLQVLAEGVETLEQIDFLQSHGCPSAQGYYYSKPVSADAFTELLQRQGWQTLEA
ncbi:EAL domain-containing protein [Noviherbaspirillum saxi]|uniref:EAL domain-containing protein n=1 Tax=Noviherbaspirillum saxi TaxID=2320863 RepID=A0A3A3FMH0_9BURK|nr:EAL domain-containing protein [Noviherbaspirillum saxi]RJF97417.1 EAL domain-containing protein [Noviherbaspirillum saxi]